jgi:polyferredoxin/tetratricopeptide (TPR) repeat protein
MSSSCVGQHTERPRSIELPVIPGKAPASKPKASRTARWRAGVLILLNLLMAAHVIQWAIMGRTISPIEPSEAMYTLRSGAVNAGFIFFILAITATLIFGRFVCGWGCHVLALQDLCAWMMKKIGLTPRPFRSRLLVYVPLIVALYMFVWPTVYRMAVKPANEPLFPGFTNHLITTDFWATFPPFWVAVPFLFVCGFMTVYFLGSKGFCTYGCPYGGFFSVADKVAAGRIRVTDACNECGHCTAACTSNVIVHAEVKRHGMVVDPGCMKCMDCVSVCPNDALYFGFGKPPVTAKEKIVKKFSLTWPEEITAAAVFFASFMSVWDVYQVVPMLMALGIAGVTTFLALRVFRLLRSDSLSFYRHNLKFRGRLTTPGWVFLCLASLWLGTTVHSGWIRYHESRAAAAFESLHVPDELALAQADPSRWLTTPEAEAVNEGRAHFQKAMDGALIVNKEALSKLAWMEYLGGNTERAVELLGRAAEYQDGPAKALSLYYKGAILNRSGRHTEAVRALDDALAERPDLASAREEKGESLWMLGLRNEAVRSWMEALRLNPRLPVTSYMLAGAAAMLNSSESAEAYEKYGAKLTIPDARFHWMIGVRLRNVGMNELADKHLRRAAELDPKLAF